MKKGEKVSGGKVEPATWEGEGKKGGGDGLGRKRRRQEGTG